MDDWWIDYPWRMIQTNLRETDMLDIDARQYVKELKEFDATIAMINFGGIISSYETDLEYHYQSPFLKGDTLEEIIKECHAYGIKVIARNDFSKVRKQLYEQHPEWAYRDINNNIIDYAGDVHVCLNGDYQQMYALKILGEIIGKFDIDGIFLNMDGYQFGDYTGKDHGLCYCNNCQRKFREMYGLDLPLAEDIQDIRYRKYLEFQKRTAEIYNNKIHKFVKSIAKNIALAAFDFYRQESGTQVGRPMPYFQHSASSNTRWVKTGLPDLRSSNTSVEFIGFAYRQISVSPANQELRLWQNMANNGDLDYYIMGRLDNHKDKSSYEGIKRVFGFHAQNQKVYQHLKSKSEILLIHEKGWDGDAEDRGWVRMLTEKHFVFDQVLRQHFDKIEISKYKVLILSDLKFMSDVMADTIDRFAENGGIVIASGQSGMYDNCYEKRESLALDCLGTEGPFTYRGDMRSSMLLMEDNSLYPAFSQWETQLVCVGDEFVFCNYEDCVIKHLKLIPPHFFGPPERCYYDFVSDHSGIYENRYGRGAGIHIPWFPGKVFHDLGHTNTIAFIGDLLETLAGISPLKTNANPMIEITHSQSSSGFDLFQFVNATGHFGNTFYNPVAVHDLWVEISCDVKPESCIALQSGKDVKFTFSGNILRVHLARLDFFEAIKIIW